MKKTNERLKYLRKMLLKITQPEFAKKIQISTQAYQSIECGKTNLTNRVLNDICREYKVRKDWLINGNNPIFLKDDDLEELRLEKIYNFLSYDGKKDLEEFGLYLIEKDKEKKRKEKKRKTIL
jgi:transcriptional regulator with XRE-family HTH domain